MKTANRWLTPCARAKRGLFGLISFAAFGSWAEGFSFFEPVQPPRAVQVVSRRATAIARASR